LSLVAVRCTLYAVRLALLVYLSLLIITIRLLIVYRKANNSNEKKDIVRITH